MTHDPSAANKPPFILDTEGRVRDFTQNMVRFNQFAMRELGAFGLFKRVALATLEPGFDPDHQLHPRRSMHHSCESFYFPAINYEPDPSDSSTRRQIALRADHYKYKGHVTDITPWLSVYTMPTVEQRGLNVDYAEVGFVRSALEIMAGRRDGGDAAHLFETMLGNDQPGNRQQMLNEQDEYILWLQRAATAVGVSPIFYDAPPEYPGAQISGN